MLRRLPIAALWLSVTRLAQTPAPAPSQTLTLTQAVAIAIQNHPQIAAAQNLEAAAGQRVIEARAPYYPALNAEVTGSQGQLSEPASAPVCLTTSQLFNRQGEGLVVNQLITDFGRTGNLVAELQTSGAGRRADHTGNPFRHYSRRQPRLLRGPRVAGSCARRAGNGNRAADAHRSGYGSGQCAIEIAGRRQFRARSIFPRPSSC